MHLQLRGLDKPGRYPQKQHRHTAPMPKAWSILDQAWGRRIGTLRLEAAKTRAQCIHMAAVSKPFWDPILVGR